MVWFYRWGLGSACNFSWERPLTAQVLLNETHVTIPTYRCNQLMYPLIHISMTHSHLPNSASTRNTPWHPNLHYYSLMVQKLMNPEFHIYQVHQFFLHSKFSTPPKTSSINPELPDFFRYTDKYNNLFSTTTLLPPLHLLNPISISTMFQSIKLIVFMYYWFRDKTRLEAYSIQGVHTSV